MTSFFLRAKWLFIVGTLLAIALRLFFLLKFPHVTGDTYIYGDIAKNWIDHGVYGFTHPGAEPEPTWIRLPGYPGFLAVCFYLFGREHYTAVMLVQLVFDVLTCFLVADLTRRMWPLTAPDDPIADRAGIIAFFLAALCPFTANYVASPMPETLSIFALAAAFWCLYVALESRQSITHAEFASVILSEATGGHERKPVILSESTGGHEQKPVILSEATAGREVEGPLLPPRMNSWLSWVGCGFFIGLATYLRPDGGILLAAVGLVLLVRLLRVGGQRRQTFVAGLIVLLVALAPLVPWAYRNWKTFDRFEPLAPRYASDLDEFTPLGFNHWVRTWMAEYVSVEDIYWQMPGSDVDVNLLPRRAYDNPQEEAETRNLFEEYQTRTAIGPELDAKFENLARERVARHPFRYYVQLPLMRIADMWFRPRSEALPLDTRWWQNYDDDFWDSAKSATLGLINFVYVALAVAGFFLKPRPRYLFVIVAYLLLRTAFLGTLENPEPRYTLECYPLITALAAVTLCHLRSSLSSRKVQTVPTLFRIVASNFCDALRQSVYFQSPRDAARGLLKNTKIYSAR